MCKSCGEGLGPSLLFSLIHFDSLWTPADSIANLSVSSLALLAEQHHEYHELNESESTGAAQGSRGGDGRSLDCHADLNVNAKGEPELVTHLL